MRKVILSAGHSNVKGLDRGAVGNGFIEGVLTVEFRDLLVKELRELNIFAEIDDAKNVLSQSISYFKNILSKDDIAIDIHFNASSNPQAKGVETLIPTQYTITEYNIASDISNAINNNLNSTLRGKNGVKTELESHHKSLGWMRLNGNNILIEICFISNPTEIAKYQQAKKQIAKDIATVIKKYI